MTMTTLPADVARCLIDASKCPKASSCRRQEPPPPERSRRQVYAAFTPDESGRCRYYIPLPRGTMDGPS